MLAKVVVGAMDRIHPVVGALNVSGQSTREIGDSIASRLSAYVRA